MTDYVYYVNPAATTGGDGTADTLTGGTCAYQTLNAAITARASTPTGTDTITYRCSGNGSTWVDGTAADVTGHAAGCLVTVEGYNGNYTGRQLGDAYSNTDCYALEVSTASVRTLTITDPDVTIRYLQVDNTNSSNFYQTVYCNTSGAPKNLVIDSCRIKATKTNSAKSGAGFATRGDNTTPPIIKNCTIEGNGNTNAATRGFDTLDALDYKVFNCTIYNFQVGIATDNFVDSDIQNVAIANCADDWSLGSTQGGTKSHNADTADGDTPGTNNQTLSTTLTDEFTAPSSGDFTVASNGASNNIWDNGTSGGSIPTVDINGTSRSNYSIGAWEYVSAAGADLLDFERGLNRGIGVGICRGS